MPVKMFVLCDGPHCRNKSVMLRTSTMPLDDSWIVIKVERFRQIHNRISEADWTNDTSNVRYLCGPMCLTAWALTWWRGPDATRLMENGGSYEIRFPKLLDDDDDDDDDYIGDPL